MTATQPNVRVIEGTEAERLTFLPSLIPGGTFFFQRDVPLPNGSLYILDITTAGVRSWRLIGGAAAGGALKYLVANQLPLQLGIFYPTLTAAVAAALADGTNPAPIYVTPGVYTEPGPGPLSLDRSIEIIGMGETPEDVIINFAGAGISVPGATNLGIKNVTITTSVDSPVVDFDGGFLQLDTVKLRALSETTTVSALDVEGSNVVIKNSTIQISSTVGTAATLKTAGSAIDTIFQAAAPDSIALASKEVIVYTECSSFGQTNISDKEPTFRRCRFEAATISPVTIAFEDRATFDGCTGFRNGEVPIIDSPGATVTLIGRGFSDHIEEGDEPYVGPYAKDIDFVTYGNHRNIKRQNINGGEDQPGDVIGEVNGDSEYVRILPVDLDGPNQIVQLGFASQQSDCSEIILKNISQTRGVDVLCQVGETFEDGVTTTVTIPLNDFLRLRVIRSGAAGSWDQN